MRLFLITTFISVITSLYAQSPWERITPLPQEHSINDMIRIPGTEKLVAVTAGSSVLFSDDAGESWDIKTNPANMSNQFHGRCVYFLDEDMGFIGGSSRTILKTTNGGNTWQVAYNSGENSNPYTDMAFSSASKGYAVGNYNAILSTNDGGNTWESSISVAGYSLKSIEFCSSTIGFIIGQSDEFLLKTMDAGISWNEIDVPPCLEDCSPSEIYFITENTGFIFAHETWPESNGVIAKTNDSGETWDIVYSDWSAYDGRFSFSDDQQGICSVGTGMYENKILLTANGGESWEEVGLPTFSWFANYAVCHADDDQVITAGRLGLMFKSYDGGNSWSSLYNYVFYGKIYDFQFVNDVTGFALGEDVTGGLLSSDLKKTSDGGNTWNHIGSTWNNQGGIYFLDENTGYLTYEDFDLNIYKTIDGGDSWSSLESGFDFEPYTIMFYDENSGIIAGEDMHAIRTTDGGSTWEEINFEPSTWNYYYDIEYTSENNIFICGEGNYNSFLLKSSDGGLNWEEIALEDFGPLWDIHALDENTIFLACNHTMILKTTDGGESWNETNIYDLEYLSFSAIHFPTETTGFAVGIGEYETMAKTIDGGDNWYPVDPGSSSGLFGVHFFDEDNGIVAGSNGLIMKTSTGGTLGTSDFSKKEYKAVCSVFPNPFTDSFTIVCRSNISDNFEFSLLDQNGQVMYKEGYISSPAAINLLDEELPPGVYFYRITSVDGIEESGKLIKL